MNISLTEYLLLFSFTSISVGYLTPRFRTIAIKMNFFDTPNSQHKTHSAPIPYLGGVAIIIGIVSTSFVAVIYSDPNYLGKLVELLLPPLFLSFIGLLDDIFNLSPWPRFIAQNFVGFIVAIALVQTNTVGSPTGSRVIDFGITILFIIILSNSINFFDNVDGGASGTVAISSLFLSILAFTNGQLYISALSIIVAGSTLGFLWWNRSPARIYMGDAGSLFLGSLLASILVRFDPNPISYPNSFFVPLFLVAIPLLDTSVAIFSRLSRRVSPFKGGRDHLSHRLMRIGIPKGRAVFSLWGLNTVFCLVALLLSNVSIEIEPFISIGGSTLWILLLALFLKMPSIDIEGINEE